MSNDTVISGQARASVSDLQNPIVSGGKLSRSEDGSVTIRNGPVTAEKEVQKTFSIMEVASIMESIARILGNNSAEASFTQIGDERIHGDIEKNKIINETISTFDSRLVDSERRIDKVLARLGVE